MSRYRPSLLRACALGLMAGADASTCRGFAAQGTGAEIRLQLDRLLHRRPFRICDRQHQLERDRGGRRHPEPQRLHRSLQLLRCVQGHRELFRRAAGRLQYMLPSRFMVGFEADFSAPNTIAGTKTFSSATGRAGELPTDTVLQFGTARERIGYAFGQWLVYGTWRPLHGRYDKLTRTQLAGMPSERHGCRSAHQKRPCCGDWAGPRAPASKCRSRRTGAPNSNIWRPISAAGRSPFSHRHRRSTPTSRCRASGSASTTSLAAIP